MKRDDLIRLARAAAGSTSRTLPDGSREHRLPAVRDAETFEPPEWVLEAMKGAYARGLFHGRRDAAGLYPEGG